MLDRRAFLLSGLAMYGAPARELFAERALQNPKFPTSPFTLGVCSGDPAPDGVVLWTRLAIDPLNGGGMPRGVDNLPRRAAAWFGAALLFAAIAGCATPPGTWPLPSGLGGVFGDIAGLPKSQLAILPGTAHVGMLSRVSWLVPMITEFLDSQTS